MRNREQIQATLPDGRLIFDTWGRPVMIAKPKASDA
jgi:hypothetical protein